MKNRKWITYTVGVLLTLVVLTAVAGAGIRFGMMQNTSFARPAFAHSFDDERQVRKGALQNNSGNQAEQGESQRNDKPQFMQGNPKDNRGPQIMQGFDNRGNNRGGISFFRPIFGLIQLVFLGLLLWIGYKFVKKSGWRLSLAKTSPAPVPTPSASEAASEVVEEKKESE